MIPANPITVTLTPTGSILTAPGIVSPDGSMPTYATIPTCAWIAGETVTAVPTTITQSVVSQGVTYTFQDTITPGSVTWNFGDGNPGSTSGSGRGTPTTVNNHPTYDLGTASWNAAPCTVYHTYMSVSDTGYQISASQGFTVTATVTSTATGGTVPADAGCGTGRVCTTSVAWGAGGSSPRHPVWQIEAIPVAP